MPPVVLTGKMKRISIVQDRQPQGCECRAYMDAMFGFSWTAGLEQWISFSSVSEYIGMKYDIECLYNLHLSGAQITLHTVYYE